MAISDYQPVPADNKTVPGTPEIQLGYGGFGPAAHAIQTQAIQQIMADLANSLASADTRIFADKATAETATVPTPVKNVVLQAYSASVNPFLGGARYREADDETEFNATPARLRFESANGRFFVINEPLLFVEMAGGGTDIADNAEAMEACGDYLTTRGGGVVYFGSGTYIHSPTRPRNYVFWQGSSKKGTVWQLIDGADANGIETEGFADFADDTDRSYSWHSSTAARNSQNYSTGKYVMVASTSTDFNNATWWEAIATPADGNEDWVQVDSVVGCVGGGLRFGTVNGNRSNQTGDYVACAWYGIDTTFQDVLFESGATCLHVEVPGQVFSTQVGENLQGTVSGIEIRDFTVAGFVNNMQSDMCFYDLQIYGPDAVLISNALLHSKQKASGQKYFGGHLWGGAAGTVGWIVDAATNTAYALEIERPVQVNQGGFQYDSGQVYRINEASEDEGPAFEIAASVNGWRINSRTSWFTYPIKINTPVGFGWSADLTYYTLDPNAAPFDPTGSTSPDPARNRWNITPTGSGDSSNNLPQLSTLRVRRRRQLIAYASSITPSHASGDFIEVGQLTGNITINNPTSSQEGDEIQFMFQQDGTGSRTLTWGSAFVGGPTAGGAAFQRRAVRFVYDGVEWIVCGDSGAWV